MLIPSTEALLCVVTLVLGSIGLLSLIHISEPTRH